MHQLYSWGMLTDFEMNELREWGAIFMLRIYKTELEYI